MRTVARLVLLMVAAIGVGAPASASDRDLSVLYVGLDPDEAVPDRLVRHAGQFADRQRDLFAERTPAFMAFLSKHFGDVRFVAIDEYRAAMSEHVDVTIFDARPTSGQVNADFDHAALMVGDIGPLTLGRMGLQLKIDHL